MQRTSYQLPPQLTPQRPVLGRLNQGVVFSCAQAEGYEPYSVYGLTITARCDIAQDKAEMYSYISVVDLRAWWHVDGLRILCNRARREQLGNLRAALVQAGHSPSIADTESPSRILQVLFPNSNGVSSKKGAGRISTIVKSIERIDNWRHSGGTLDSVRAACTTFAGLRRALMSELVSQRLLGFYFLSQIEFDGADAGYVVCLRDVRHISRDVAAQVGCGLPKPRGETPREIDTCLSFAHEDFAMPIGTLPSPLLEHLMQTFSLLFGRIGLADLPDSYVSGLWERQGLDGPDDD